ncbi:unnamed protein product, partial [Didymodactylos carnosus]
HGRLHIISFQEQVNMFALDILSKYGFEFLPNYKLNELYPDVINTRFVPLKTWLTTKNITYDTIPEFMSSTRLMSLLISNGKPLAVFGENGFGKSTMIKRLLSTKIHHIRLVSNGKPSLLCKEFKDNIPIIMHETQAKHLSWKQKYVIWIDDVNLQTPTKEDGFTTEFFRSLLDDYDDHTSDALLTTRDFLHLKKDWNFVFSGVPQCDSQMYSYIHHRFSRHIVTILIHEHLSLLIETIFSLNIKNWLEEFPAESINHPIELAQACLLSLEEIFDSVRKRLHYSPNYTLGIFNLHHVSSIVEGMMLMNGKEKRIGKTKLKLKKKQENVPTVIRLLCHELSRMVLDRIPYKDDRIWFQELVYRTIVTNFCTELEFHIVAANDTSVPENQSSTVQETSSSQELTRTPSTELVNPTEVRPLKKQVKFKLGLVSDRSGTLNGPLISFAKLLAIPKGKGLITDPSKIQNISEYADRLCSNYFCKQILYMHGEYTGSDQYNNNYCESNYSELVQAFHSCHKMFTKSTKYSIDLAFIDKTVRHLVNIVRILSLNQGHALLHAETYGMGRQDLVQMAAFISRTQFFDGHMSNTTFSNDENENVRLCLRQCCLLAGLKQKNCVIVIREHLLNDEMLHNIVVFLREGIYSDLYSSDELCRIAAALSPGLPSSRRVTKTNSVLKSFYARIKKRLHIIIFEDYQSGRMMFHQRYPLSLSSCYVDQYETWTKESLILIAKHWLEKDNENFEHTLSLQSFKSTTYSLAIINLLASALAEIHLISLKEIHRCDNNITIESYKHPVRIKNTQTKYFTLKMIKRTIDYLYKFDKNISEGETDRSNQYEMILARTNKTENMIEYNKELCKKLQLEIDDISKKLAKIEAELAEKKKAFTTALEDCREEERLLEEMATALEKLKKDMQEDFSKANPQYEAALSAVQALKKADYDEIRTFRQPPQPVLAVMNTICIMFGKKPEWNEAKVLTVKENFFDDLIYYDKENITDEVYSMLAQIVQFDTFRPSFVACSSKAAASICAWIIAVFEYSTIARSIKSKVQQVKAYEDLYKKRQQIMGEKRLKAETIKKELEILIRERNQERDEMNKKLKRLQFFQQNIEKTSSMLNLIGDDVEYWIKQLEKSQQYKLSVVGDSLLVASCLCYLSTISADRRNYVLEKWLSLNCFKTINTSTLNDGRSKGLSNENYLPIRANFNFVDVIMNEKDRNDYYIQIIQNTNYTMDINSVINAITIDLRHNNNFVLILHNPEHDLILWISELEKDFESNIEEAQEDFLAFQRYQQQNPLVQSSGQLDSAYRAESQQRDNLFSRISSSKTYITEVTEKSSIWESSTVASRAPTSMLLTKSAATVALSDLQGKNIVSLPQLDYDYTRPEKNVLILMANDNELEKKLINAMYYAHSATPWSAGVPGVAWSGSEWLGVAKSDSEWLGVPRASEILLN